ncbi:glycosyl hydrolase family 28 protein [Pelagicoccus enzymogenes]|uniref:glycoside hydrolase family 28 protein n=1 Tax=Pelagicoccus enzymogenes TaxID=2773457 RepID=UPI0028100ECA|nr:right-handed parallel beta-helix repeat-containing protein [Pelagicoccus enzymogenes]MDQ8201183.1 glycosyl hydrolase family 28 protein [Pelagicoccus enzymogenes]
MLSSIPIALKRSLVSFAILSCALASAAAQNSKFHDVIEHGALPDGETLNTKAIQSAIDRASEVGGGVVYFPPGRYLTGTIFLKSHVTLHLENGAVLLGSLDIDDYEAVGEERLNHSARQQRHLIYAGNAEGIAIEGKGIIDGRGPEFWPKDFRTMEEIEIRAAMTLPDGFSTRPGTFVMIENCTNVWLTDVIFRNSPHHMMKVQNSENVIIDGISIEQGIYEDDGPNTDGLGISGSKFRISNSSFQTGDDCLVIGDTQHFTLTNCTFTTTESAIVLSGLRDGTISNCSIFDAGAALNIRPGRGGLVENVTINNINYTLDRQLGGNLVFARSKPIEVRESVQSWADRWGIDYQPSREPAPVVRNISFTNIAAKSDGLIFIDGLPEQWIEDITFDQIRFEMRGGLDKPDSAEPPHPFYIFGHHTAPYGIYCRYVANITLRDIKFTWSQPERPEWGSALRVHHGSNIEIEGFNGRHSAASSQASIELADVEGVTIRDSQAAAGTNDFLALLDGTTDVALIGNDLRKAKTVVHRGPGVKKAAVHQFGNIE